VIVADDTRSEWGRRHVADSVASFAPRAVYTHHFSAAGEPFSIGRLRDGGAAAAPHGLVLFHDVDFFAPPGVYRQLKAALAGRLSRELSDGGFLCLPVAFLSRIGTVAARGLDDRRWGGLVSPWARRLGLVDRLVMASSAIVVDRRVLLAEGGHSTAFTGHGAEDFELMHRLAMARPRGPRPPDYPVDYGSRGAHRGGFRAYFARYAAPLAAEGLHLAHAWHARREEDPRYYAEQRHNFARLQAQLRASMSDERADGDRWDGGADNRSGPRSSAADSDR
jgi:predicted glycosyltransferase involved in capsule biosynthesis